MERKEERVMARQSIFKFNERVTTEAKDATYEFRGTGHQCQESGKEIRGT